MYPELSGKKALVTGATRGFGRAIAFRLAQEGAAIAVNYRRSKSDALQLVDEIKSAGGTAFAVRADVGDDEALDRMFAEIAAEFGSLDILIANAAFGVPGPILNATQKYWDLTLSASAKSLLSLAQKALPLMTGDVKRIVSLTSSGGQRVLPEYGLVGVAKAALEAITRALAVELAPQGIVVNGVLAGVADTKSFRALSKAEDFLVQTVARTPMQRLVEPHDIADVVAFLCSDQAKMICGQFVTVDGGYDLMA